MEIGKILQDTAEMNGITVEELRERLQKAINEAWEALPDNGGGIGQIPCKGDVPTPEEFVCYVAEQISKIQDG